MHNILWPTSGKRLSIAEDGGGGVDIKLVNAGTDLAVESITFSRHTVMTITVDWVAGTLEVSGATTGNGIDTDSATAWSSATLYVGSNSTTADHFDGLIGQPEEG